MLKEICITPQVFDAKYMDLSNWKDVKNVLDIIADSGYIVGLNNKDWTRLVLQNISHLDPKIKTRLTASIQHLKNRDRIVGQPKVEEGELASEKAWYQLAKDLDVLRHFHKIIATEAFDSQALSLESLEDTNIYQEFGITGSEHSIKSAENLSRILLPFLSYSKKLTIIDPYFYLSAPRYENALEIVAKCFMERRGQKGKGSITINCKWDNQTDFLLNKWQAALSKIARYYPHKITVNAWSLNPGGLKMHDRYFITNQGGLVSAAGADQDDRQQSEWSIKDYKHLGEVLAQYKPNSSPFGLACVVTKSGFERL